MPHNLGPIKTVWMVPRPGRRKAAAGWPVYRVHSLTPTFVNTIGVLRAINAYTP